MFEEFSSTKAMYGENAVHVPCWMIMQEHGGAVSFVGASKNITDLKFGSNMTHQCVVGEIIVRPHLVLESERFVGHGLTGLATSSMDWMQPSYSKVLIDAVGKMTRAQREDFNARYLETT
jgi:hypothetical protein